MSRSELSNKVPRQSIFRETRSRFLVIVSLDAYCCHFFAFFLHCSELFREGEIVSWAYACRPLAEIRDRFKGETYIQILRFIILESLCFGEKKSTKLGQIQSRKFSLLLFDQMWFRSNVVSIKCHFDQVSFGLSVVRSTVGSRGIYIGKQPPRPAYRIPHCFPVEIFY